MVRAWLHSETPLLWSGARMWRGVTEAEPFLTGRSTVLAGDARHARFLAYPISRRAADRGRALVNWVCMVSEAEPGPLTEDASWNRAGRADDVLPYYRDFALGWLDVPALITGSREILEYPMVDRDPLPRWGSGRVTLLGDAAHPMYPVGANGASQAIVDAGVLADELAGTDDVIAALARYEEARREPTSAVVRANREMNRAERQAAARGDHHAYETITDDYRRVAG